MSKVAISGNASGTGTLTIAAPNTNSNYTLNLPAETGTFLTNKTVGTVLQVVNATYGTVVSTTSSTFVDTGLTASITPSSSTNKILVLLSLNGVGKNANNAVGLRLVRGSTNILGIEGILLYTNSTAVNYASASTGYLDSPATTSSTTYKVQIMAAANVSAVYINNYYNAQSEVNSTITLMEIAA